MVARPSTPSLRRLLPLLLLALGLRAGAVAWSVIDHPDFFRPAPERIAAELSDPREPFVDPLGFEVSNVAWSLVCADDGFASPFGGGTGPTGWVSPGIVAVWAAVFSAAGCFTPGSVVLLLVVAGIASALMVVLAARAGACLGGDERTGRIAALLVACSPWEVLLFHAATLMDLNLYALGLLGLIALLAALWRTPSWGGLVALSVASAVAALFSPQLALAAAAGLAVLLVRPPGRALRPGRAVTVFAVAHLLVVGPWILHQHRTLGGWSFVKSNARFEVALGNRPEVSGLLRPETFREHHPSLSVDEYRSYRRLGESAYVADRFERFVRSFDPARFAAATGRRFLRLFFWHVPEDWQGPWSRLAHRLLTAVPGLVFLLYPFVRRPDRGDALIYLATAGYVAPFLVAGVMERYTLALSVPTLLLVARALASAAAGRTRGWLRRSGAPGGRTGARRVGEATGPGSGPSAPVP